jgi:hypothetical protein
VQKAAPDYLASGSVIITLCLQSVDDRPCETSVMMTIAHLLRVLALRSSCAAAAAKRGSSHSVLRP